MRTAIVLRTCLRLVFASSFLLGYIELDPKAVLVISLLLYLTAYSDKAKAACIEIASKCRKEAETRAATNRSRWMKDLALFTRMVKRAFNDCIVQLRRVR